VSVRILRYLRAADIEDELRRIDPETSVICIPGSEERRRLRDLLEKTGCPGDPRSGGVAGRYRLRTWSDWYLDLCRAAGALPGAARPPAGQIDPPDHWLVLRYVLDELEEERPRSQTPRPGIIRLLGQEIRGLLREEVAPEDLASALGTGESRGSPGRTGEDGDAATFLCRTYLAYRNLLASRGLADSAEIPTLARKLLPFTRFPPDTEVVFVGFLSFTRGQLLFIRELASRGFPVRIYAPETRLPGHHDVEDQFPESDVAFIPSSPLEGVLLEAGDRRMQYDAICRELVLWSYEDGRLGKLRETCGFPFPGWGTVAIVAPEGDAGLAEECLTRYRIPFTPAYAATVADSLPFLIAERILDLDRWNWPPDACANLLSHPVFFGDSFPRARFDAERPRGADAWRAFLSRTTRDEEPFARAFRFAQAVRAGSRPSDLLRAFVSLATDSPSWDRTLSSALRLCPGADGDIRGTCLAVEEARRKADLLESTERGLGIAGSSRLEGSDAEAFFREWARSSTLWFPPERYDTVRLYPGAPPVLAHAPVWIAAGMDASGWPGTISESPILSDERKRDIHDRFSLGASHLPLLPEVRMQREALFRRILAGGDRITIVCRPYRDDAGKPVERSPFLKRATDTPGCGHPFLRLVAAADVHIRRDLGDLLPQETAAAVVPPESRAVPRPGGIIRVPTPPEDFAERDHAPFRLSVSDLDLLLSCPFRYASLRIRKLDDTRPGLYRTDLAGRAAHAIFARISESGDLRDEAVRRCIAEGFGEYASLGSDPRLAAWRSRFEETILRTVGSMRLLEKSLAPKRTEVRTETPLPEATFGDVTVHGRCDRMDILDDGSVLLFDFKSGLSKSYGRTDRAKTPTPPSLQLAAYAWLCENAPARLTVAGTVYVCMSDAVFAASFPSGSDLATLFAAGGIPSVTNSLLENHIPFVGGELSRAAALLSGGRFAPNYDSTHCRICGFQTLCRRSDRHGEENDDAPDE